MVSHTGCCARTGATPGLREDFQILDSDDQLRCIRRVLRDLDLDEQRWPPRQAQGFINARKDEGLRAEHLEEQSDWLMERMRSIYSAYQEMCERTGVESSISPSCCCGATSCFATATMCSRTTRNGSATSSSTSSRTPIPSSTRG